MLELLARTSGTWVNVAAIVAGSTVGVVAGGRLPERLNRTLMQVLGLVTLYVGLGMARGRFEATGEGDAHGELTENGLPPVRARHGRCLLHPEPAPLMPVPCPAWWASQGVLSW